MSGGKGETDPTFTLMVMLLLVWGFAALAWYFFRAEILQVERAFRMAEIWLVAPFDSRVPACFTWLKEASVGTPPPRGNWVVPTPDAYKAAVSCFREQNIQLLGNSVQGFEYYNVTPTSLGIIATMINGYLRWPVVVMCILMGIHAIFISPRNKFKTRYNLESFIRAQSAMWPVISPIVSFNPSTSSARIPGNIMPDKTPVFAEAFTPEEWLSWHRIPMANGIPDKEALRRAFFLQLGPRWKGVKSLPPHMLALFAAFALKGVQKREESDDLLGRLALAWTPKGGFQMDPKLMDEVRKIANNPDIGGRALEIADKHAYRTTALIGVLKWARFMGGVLAPGQFLWLRAEDRNLWYPLNNVGRRSFHSEGAGAMSHFMAEQMAQKPLPVPRVDTAVLSINKYLVEEKRAKPVVPPREEPNGRRALQTT